MARIGRPPKPKPGARTGHGRKSCVLCTLRLAEPLRARAIEDRLALGEGPTAVVRDHGGFNRHQLTRHWNNHCDQASILRRVHRADRDERLDELVARSTVDGTAPLVICDRQIEVYVREFESARREGDANARDAADRRLFQWARLKHRILVPLTLQYGPSIQNNVIVAGQGGDFGALVARIERRLLDVEPPERERFVALLRESDEAAD
jgi:hypothetical protein